jgi:hypothetical protein
MKSGCPISTSSAYESASSMFHDFTKVSLYTVLCCLVRMRVKERVNLSQKSLNNGLSIALSESFVAASTETYNWVTGSKRSIHSGN